MTGETTPAPSAANRTEPGEPKPGQGGAPLLEVSDLRVSFPSEEGRIDAVRRGELTASPDGEVLAIVGESGSGKSVSFAVAVDGVCCRNRRGSPAPSGCAAASLLGLGDKQLSKLRGSAVSMVFQDPLSALTPVLPGGPAGRRSTARPRQHEQVRGSDTRDRTAGSGRHLPIRNYAPGLFRTSSPGVMRQRVVIAMAIANDPALIICDEPTTALDVTVQKQILNLLRKARDITGAGVVMITHDMGIAATLADRVAVMYAGKIVESAPTAPVFRSPRMPYTVGLLGAIPRMDGPARGAAHPDSVGAPPAMHALPPGCSFAPRCPVAIDECRTTEPPLADIEPGHHAACLRTAEVDSAALFDAYRQEIRRTGSSRDDRSAFPVLHRVTDLIKTFPITSGIILRRRKAARSARWTASVSRSGPGARSALVGESRSGKSTTLHPDPGPGPKPQSGTIEIMGRDTAPRLTPSPNAANCAANWLSSSRTPPRPWTRACPSPTWSPSRCASPGRPKSEIARRVPELLRQVGLRPEHADRYPPRTSPAGRSSASASPAPWPWSRKC